MQKYSLCRKTGELYEQYACDLLEKNGYDIVDRNFTTKKGEIDIIAKDKKHLCFIEVKALRECVPFKPEESVTAIKMKKITDTSIKYLYHLQKYYGIDISELNLRYDVLSIRFNDIGIVTSLIHYRDYFKPDMDFIMQMLNK